MELDLEEIRRSMDARPTPELVSIFRNRDVEEWRPEVFDIVASILAERGVSPSEVAAQGPEGIDVVEGQDLVTLGRFFSPAEAHAHRAALDEAGIAAWVQDEGLGTMYGVGIGARLQVRAEDEAAARQLLAQVAPVPASELPPELAEPPCPQCGSRNVTQAAAIVAAAVDPTRRQWQNQCQACGHVWPAAD
jgi:hypothetical protein